MFIAQLLGLATLLSITPTSLASSSTSMPPKGIATWAYDAQYPQGPTGQPDNKAGLWEPRISNYNYLTKTVKNRISIIFSYGGDMEMYCEGSGDSQPQTLCNQSNMFVYYNSPGKPGTGDNGQQSSQAYATTYGVNAVMPIVDGRLDGQYLSAFNKLTKKQSQTYANELAQLYCSDDTIDGVQIDLEPLNPNKKAQLNFYQQVAKDFTTNAYQCKDSKHPSGRYFSVFGFASAATPKMWKTLGKNGFFVDSGYDLSKKPAGTLQSPQQYGKKLYAELTQMKRSADSNHGYYMIGLPAAASTHEFERYVKSNGAVIDEGYQQLDYIKQAIAVIKKLKIPQDPYFLGISLWGWSEYMAYPPHSNNLFYPNIPEPETLNYLRKNL